MGERKVDFMIIGAMKSATTSLHAYLNQHPRIFLSNPKETDFFIEEKNLSKGLDWYHGLFKNADQSQLLGEATTSYTKLPDFTGVAERIYKYNDKVKLIYLVRNPIERAISHYRHSQGFGRVDLPFEKEIRQDISKYVQYGRYSYQIYEYLKYFDKNQILIVQSEKLISQPKQTLAEILEFLGLDSISIDVSGVFNNSQEKTKRTKFNKILRENVFIKVFKRLTPRFVTTAYLKLTEKKLPNLMITPDDEIFLKTKFKEDVNTLMDEFHLDLNYWPQWEN